MNSRSLRKGFGRLAIFVRFLRSPSQIGAIAPSSPFLARATAKTVRELGAATDVTVYELGPGTGALTQELSKLGNPLVLIERQPEFVQILRDRFPTAQVREEDCLRSEALNGASRGSILVSSLPILSIPEPERFKNLFFECLRSGRFDAIIQYSYGLGNPLRPLPSDIRVERSTRVMINMPPATLWVYRRA